VSGESSILERFYSWDRISAAAIPVDSDVSFHSVIMLSDKEGVCGHLAKCRSLEIDQKVSS